MYDGTSLPSKSIQKSYIRSHQCRNVSLTRLDNVYLERREVEIDREIEIKTERETEKER